MVYRRLALGDLAKASAVAPSYLSEIEARKKPGSTKALAALGKALRVSIEDLLVPKGRRSGPPRKGRRPVPRALRTVRAPSGDRGPAAVD